MANSNTFINNKCIKVMPRPQLWCAQYPSHQPQMTKTMGLTSKWFLFWDAQGTRVLGVKASLVDLHYGPFAFFISQKRQDNNTGKHIHTWTELVLKKCKNISSLQQWSLHTKSKFRGRKGRGFKKEDHRKYCTVLENQLPHGVSHPLQRLGRH
jgi:hypothetical protein